MERLLAATGFEGFRRRLLEVMLGLRRSPEVSGPWFRAAEGVWAGSALIAPMLCSAAGVLWIGGWGLEWMVATVLMLWPRRGRRAEDQAWQRRVGALTTAEREGAVREVERVLESEWMWPAGAAAASQMIKLLAVLWIAATVVMLIALAAGSEARIAWVFVMMLFAGFYFAGLVACVMAADSVRRTLLKSKADVCESCGRTLEEGGGFQVWCGSCGRAHVDPAIMREAKARAAPWLKRVGGGEVSGAGR